MSITKEKTPNCKVVLLGESGVGKTCIIARYINGTYDEKSESTNGASYASKTISYDNINKSLQFDIWDTAGQERYRALTKFFYKDAAIAILVYDITRKESFDEMKNYWYNQLKNFSGKNIIIGIAGNKSDLYDKEAVSEEEARNFATEIGAIFRLTSACNNNNIDELFKAVGNSYLDPKFQDNLISEKAETKGEANTKITADDLKDQLKKKKNKGNCKI